MARNGDGLYQRGRIWYFKHRDSDGQFREHSTGKTKQSEARNTKHEFIEKHRLGLLRTEMAEFTLDQALRERLAYLAATGSSSSQAPHGSSVRHLLAALGGSRRLKTITARDLQQYQLTRSATIIRGRKTSAKTINNELLLLRSVLKQARLWKGLEEDYKPLKVQKRGPGQALTVAQGEHLIRTAKQRDEWFVAMRATVLAYSTGCRSYEIKSLQLEDLWLDRECPSIRIQREKTKSNAGSREVALNAFAVWAIRELLLRARMLGASEPDHYLFPANLSKHTKHGDPMKEQTGYDPSHHQNSWSSAWESLKKAAGLSKFRFHDLRHTFITQGIEADVPVHVMKSQVGHMSAEMVEHYTHLSVNAKMKAAEKVQEQNPGIADVLGITSPIECKTEISQRRSRLLAPVRPSVTAPESESFTLMI